MLGDGEGGRPSDKILREMGRKHDSEEGGMGGRPMILKGKLARNDLLGGKRGTNLI